MTNFKKIFFILFFICLLSSCKKEDNNFFDLTMNNYDVYDCEIDESTASPLN